MLPDGPARCRRREVLRLRPYLWAAAGGALGALGRWGLGAALPHAPWPWATLAVNLLGCFLVGALLAGLAAHRPAATWPRPFLGAGVLGGFTTYSAFTVEVVQAVDDGAVLLAFGYVVASVVGGLLAVVLGALSARAVPGGAPS
jgi:fluoride exporter